MFDVNKLIDEQSFQNFIKVFKNAKPVATITATDLEQYGVKQVLQWGPNFVELPPTYKINPNDIPWPEVWEGFWTEMHQVKLLATIWKVTPKELAARFGMTDSGVRSALNAPGYMKPSLQDRPLKWARAITLIAREKYSPASPPTPPPVHTGEGLAAEIDATPLPTRESSSPMSIGDFIDMLKTPIGQLSFEEATKVSAVLEMIDDARGR